MFDRIPFVKGLMLTGVGLFLLWQCVQSLSLNRRIDTNFHVRGTVERTWVSGGKHASRYADVNFPGPIGIGLCEAKAVRLGSRAIDARPGQAIDLVPIPGSCDNPDAASARELGFLLMFEFAGAFAAFLYGVMTLIGLVGAGGAPSGYARTFR